MSEEDTKPEEGTESEEAVADNFMNSINMAFNLGVAAHQEAGQSKSVVEIATELGNQIYQNFAQAYGGEINESFLKANTEYFLQIALMGYIIPGCALSIMTSRRNSSLLSTREPSRTSRDKAEGNPRAEAG